MSQSLIRLLVTCGVGLAVVVGIWFSSNLSVRARNLALGIGAVGLFAIVAAYFSLKPMLAASEEPPQRYVAYFEHGGGLEPGDVVRIKGRRAGHVVATEIVRREGKVMIRVEFDIAPGSSSPWLKQGGIPAASVISVRQPALLGRPTLSIELGDGQEIIPIGAEWKRAVSGRSEDQFTNWLGKIRQFEAAIDKYMAYVQPELIADIKLRIAQIRVEIDNARAAVEDAVLYAPDLVRRMDELGRLIAELREQFHESAPDVTKRIETLQSDLENAPAAAADAQDAVAKLRDQVAGISESLSELAARAEAGEFGKGMRDLRRVSAQLRAGAVVAERNPKRIGDMPPWRRARPYFNGGSTALEAAATAEKGGAVEFKELPLAPKPRQPQREND